MMGWLERWEGFASWSPTWDVLFLFAVVVVVAGLWVYGKR